MSNEDVSRWEDEGGFVDRDIPDNIVVLLRQVLYPSAWHRWMNASIGSLRGRTPWECIDDGDMQAVVNLLESYADGSFT